jgi:hypothetical protein
MYAILNEPSPANVFFQQTGNWNTPAEQGFRLWMEKAQLVAEAIRYNAPDAIVVVGGSDHAASQMSFYFQNPFTIGWTLDNAISVRRLRMHKHS